MNKSDLVRAISAETGLSRAKAADALNTAIIAMTEALARGERVQLNGFGVFEPKERPARMGRNPKTGEPTPIPAARTVAFRPSDELKKPTEE